MMENQCCRLFLWSRQKAMHKLRMEKKCKQDECEKSELNIKFEVVQLNCHFGITSIQNWYA